MIQVYKKNGLFIVEDTVRDIIYPNLTRKETVNLLKKFDRDEVEDRCDFAITSEEYIDFKYVSLDEKDQQIAELEEQLKNAIVLPKYEKGQKIYYIYGENIKEAYFQSFAEDIWVEAILNPQEITDEDGYTEVDFDVDMIYYKNAFATKEEAEARLRELQENEKID